MGDASDQEMVAVINRARAFQELLDDDRWKLLINSVSTDIFLEWSNTDDGGAAKELWHRIKGLKALQEMVDKIIADGRIVAEKIQQARAAESNDYGSRPKTGGSNRGKRG